MVTRTITNFSLNQDTSTSNKLSFVKNNWSSLGHLLFIPLQKVSGHSWWLSKLHPYHTKHAAQDFQLASGRFNLMPIIQNQFCYLITFYMCDVSSEWTAHKFASKLIVLFTTKSSIRLQYSSTIQMPSLLYWPLKVHVERTIKSCVYSLHRFPSNQSMSSHHPVAMTTGNVHKAAPKGNNDSV